MVQFKAAYLSLGGRSLAGGSSSLPLGPSKTCLIFVMPILSLLKVEKKIFSNMSNFNVSRHVIYYLSDSLKNEIEHTVLLKM